MDDEGTEVPPEISSDLVLYVSRSVAFLRDWPVENLRGNSQACTVYYFDRNQLIVRDSNNSDWIYIVLKGSLSVVKKLKRLEPQSEPATPRKKPRISILDPREALFKHLKKTQASRWQRRYDKSDGTQSIDSNNNSAIPNGRLENYFKTPFELESKLEQTLPGYYNSQERLGTLNYDNIIKDFRSRLVNKSPGQGSLDRRNSRRRSDVFSQSDADNDNYQQGNRSTVYRSSPGSISSDPSYSNEPATLSPRKPIFLPDITKNNKVVKNGRQHKHRNHSEEVQNVARTTGVQNGAKNGDMQNVISTDGMPNATSSVAVQNGASTIDTTLDLFSDDDADDEQGSMSSEYGPDFNKRRRKRKRISKTTKGVYLARSRDRGKSSDVDDLSSELGRSTSPEPADEDNLETVPEKENKEETISEKLARLQIQYQRRVIDREGRKTIAEELDQKARRDFRFTEVDLDPTIIELQVLERGQYFGVTPLLFPDQPSLSVISNGAECLVLSKKLFMQWASEKCLRNLRQTESPYPSDQELMRKLQDVVNWQASRSVIFSQLDTEIQVRKAKRRQFLPSYGGQYCFRTGPA